VEVFFVIDFIYNISIMFMRLMMWVKQLISPDPPTAPLDEIKIVLAPPPQKFLLTPNMVERGIAYPPKMQN
jgi:hypothetical protein